MMEILKQPQYSPLSVAEIALSWFIADKGFLDDIELNKMRDFELGLRQYAHDKYQSLLDQINKDPTYNDDIAHQLKTAVEDFKKNGSW